MDSKEDLNEGNGQDVKIQAINRETVHRICSGQVVLSLAVAVKELIENSIDAGATNIEIKLKNYGMELLEVVDNGSGVKRENFEALTLKHYTSKIRQFDDLESVNTLGFRGEALSSLSALSDLTITTRHSSEEHGTKIKYDKNGKILSEDPVARQLGTTVTLAELFSPLPVRRKEFVKNHKREFSKMCNLLYAYCLVSKGVKLSCTNQTSKGSQNKIVTTRGLSSIKENIISVFGAKQISSLIEIELVKPELDMAQEFGLNKLDDEESPFQFDFFISSVVHGNGRSASDRQFYFINSRPCDPTKLSKLVNDTYRQFNTNQYPFVYLNVIVKRSCVDVNVTPDKRQIFLEKEKLLLATVKATLLNSFKLFPSTYQMQDLNESRSSKRNNSESFSLESFRKKPRVEEAPNNMSLLCLKNFKIETKKSDTIVDEPENVNSLKLERFKIDSKESENFDRSLNKTEDSFENDANDSKEFVNDEKRVMKSEDNKIDSDLEEYSLKIKVMENKSVADDKSESAKKTEIVNRELDIVTDEDSSDDKYQTNLKLNVTIAEFNASYVSEKMACGERSVKKHKPKISVKTDNDAVCSGLYRKNRRTVQLSFSMDRLRTMLEDIKQEHQTAEPEIRFRTEIEPKNNEKAQTELEQHITKDLFAKMHIVGQFNHAFIITKLQSDLFIIDQHATDEKYNFEQLQQFFVVQSQNLIAPKDLQLTAAYESLLIENLEVFHQNGFDFVIDESAEATKKVKLNKVPLSKNYIFGKDDIDEMLYMLQEGYSNHCRPSRIRGMFASRACRKSVMVGKILNKIDMRTLVNHMGEIEQPWNCPHGRPTMRHLINLDLIAKLS